MKNAANREFSLRGSKLTAVAALFATLSEPTRLRILQVVQHGPVSVGEIVEATGMKQANASKQLGILYQAGVVDRTRDGNLVRYSIKMPIIYDLCHLVCNGLRDDANRRAAELSVGRRR